MEQQIMTLSHREQARKKLPVYFGSNDNFYHPIREVVVNARDILQGVEGARIEVVLHDDNKTVTVKDNGSGLPMDGSTNGVENYKLLFLTLFSGTKMEEGTCDGGTNGCGNTVICYTSDYMEITTKRNGKIYNIAFENGGEILKPLTCLGNTTEQGTEITFRLSDAVYTQVEFDAKEVEFIVEKIVATSSNITSIFKYGDYEKVFTYSNLENYFNQTINETALENIILNNKTFEDKYFDKDSNEEKSESTTIEMVINNSEETIQHSFLNGIYLPKLGTIHEGVIDGLRDVINKFIKDNGLYDKKEKQITRQDIEESTSYVCSVLSTKVSFSNQTKFSTEKELYKTNVKKYIQEFFEIYSIEQKENLSLLAQKVLINKRAREKSELIKNDTKKKLSNDIKFTDSIKNYKPCKIKDKTIAELYLNEGSSALGGMLKSRNSDFQAGYHVGGKMKSVLKASESSIFSNEVVNNLYKILGCGTVLSKSKYNKEKLPPYDFDNLNWSKIVISTDQDIDAYQIRCLILTCIYVMSPDLIEKGVIYIAEAPLFEITISNGKGKEDEVLFAYTDKEKDNILLELDKKGIKYNTPERNKGLGEMEKYSMSKAIMNPKTRRITKVTMSDVEKMVETFEIWMGEDIQDRKNIITNNFDYVEHFEDVSEKDIVQILNENYLPYAIDIVKNRAIIAVDGFKPAHRKLLWTLHENNLYNKRTKSANIVGNNMSYNVHGDGSIYQTLVRMAQDDTLLYPYVNGKGNFGQHTSKDLDEAHMRYTEAGAADINKEFFKDINKNAVELVDNFDGQKKEPKLLPTTFPNLLVNYNSGIAVGMASTTPSFPLIDVCNTTIAYIKDKNIEVIDYLKAPDFATGGYIIYNREELIKIYNEGKGNITLRAKYKVEENTIIITEIPYTTCVEAIVDTIKSLCKTQDDKFKCITDVLDTTELEGMSITIKIKKNTDVEKLMKLLYLKTPLESKQSFNMNIICLDEIPRIMGIKRILDEWIKFREQSISNVLQYDVDNKSKELNKLYGLQTISDNKSLDKAIQLIRSSKSEIEAVDKLIKEFNLNQEQSEYISTIKLININKDWITKKIKNIKDLEQEIKDLKTTISDDNKINEIIIKDLERVRDTYGKPRRTEIIYESDVQEITKEDLIDDKNVTIILTKHGYLKKLIKNMDSQKLKEDDEIIDTISTTNHSELSLITDKNNMYRLKIWELEEHKPSQLGTYLKNEIKDIESDANIIKGISIQIKNKNKGNVLVCFKNGNVAKIKVDKFKSGVSKAINVLNTESPILKIMQITNDIDLTFLTSEGKLLIINTSTMNPVGSKNGKGVRCIKLGDNELVGVMDNITNESVIKVQTEKKDCIDLKLNDNNKNDISYYYSEKRDKQGNFVLNCRQKKDKIIKILE